MADTAEVLNVIAERCIAGIEEDGQYAARHDLATGPIVAEHLPTGREVRIPVHTNIPNEDRVEYLVTIRKVRG